MIQVKPFPIDEIAEIFPNINAELENVTDSDKIISALFTWLDSHNKFGQASQTLQSVIDSKVEDTTVTESAELLSLNQSQFNRATLEAFATLSYDQQRIFKKILEIYLVKKFTPTGIREQQFPQKYIVRDTNGDLHLKPEKLSIEITKNMLDAYSDTNPEGYNIRESILYKSEKYAISTAGFRARQNKLYPWDGREKFNFFAEVITAFSQNMVLIANNIGKNEDIIEKVTLLNKQILEYKNSNNCGNMRSGVVLSNLLYRDKNLKTLELTGSIAESLEKLAGGEVRFNTELYQELYARVAANFGISLHVSSLGGEKTSIWMASFLIFLNEYDGGNYLTSSHTRDDYQCSKDLSEEGAQILPDISLQFAAVNEWVLEQIEQNGDFVVEIAAEDDPKITRDIDGIDEYIQMLRTNVLTESNTKLVEEARKKGWKGIIQDNVGGCMGPLMHRLLDKTGLLDLVTFLNNNYDPFQNGIGKDLVLKPKKFYNSDFVEKAILEELVYDDQGVDVSNTLIAKRMGYDILLQDKPIGQVITNTDPDGDRLICGEILKNSKETINLLADYGVEYIELDSDKIYAYYSPNKMFLITTAYYLDSLIKSEAILKDDTVVIIKTAQTSYAFNEYSKSAKKKYGINIVCMESTVGFKEIAALERRIEVKMENNKDLVRDGKTPVDIIVKDTLGVSHNLGIGNIVLLSASEESGGQELAPPNGLRSKSGRKFALGNREKSAGVSSMIVIPFAAELFIENKHIIDYWKNLITEYELTFIQDARADIFLYDPGTPDPLELTKLEKIGNALKVRNNTYWWNLAKHYTNGEIDLSQVKEELAKNFSQVSEQYIKSLVGIRTVLTDSSVESERAKDGVYLLFKEFYIAIRPSGTEAKIKGYYSGRFSPKTGFEIANAFGQIDPTPRQLSPDWLVEDYYETDDYK